MSFGLSLEPRRIFCKMLSPLVRTSWLGADGCEADLIAHKAFTFANHGLNQCVQSSHPIASGARIRCDEQILGKDKMR
jgi:hypothetical protein